MKEKKIIFENITDLDLAQTLDCGQAFRWTENPDGTFCGIVKKTSVKAELKDKTLTLYGADEKERDFFRAYFDLDYDYAKAKAFLSGTHLVMSDAAKYAGGIRILHQDSFEALISFIISQNNNISRIKGIIGRLCENFGEKLGDGNDASYAFPKVEVLASLSREDLAPIRAGFRDRYIIDAAKKVESGDIDLEKTAKMDYADAQKELMKIKGVGVKVADCVLLYGMHRLESFPKDVWMKRAMSILFSDMDSAVFGEYAGIAQQYIFHYSRMHPELFK